MRRLRYTVRVAAAAMLASCVAGTAAAGPVTIVNGDPPNVGLNDPTPAAPVGGNTGTTVGAQRLIALQFAADIWGAILNSQVEIQIGVEWLPLNCSPTSGFLGFAGAQDIERDFLNAPLPMTWFPVAEANKLAGMDLSLTADISAAFNTEVGTAGCLTNFTWYYGIDNQANQNTQFDLVTTALHEFAHGLGQLSFVNISTGEAVGGFLDIYSTFLFDHTAGKSWGEMTNAERAASAVNFGNVVWTGPAVTRDAATTLGPRPELEVQAPPSIAGTVRVGTAAFGAPLALTPVSGQVVLANDGATIPSDACQPLLDDLTGRIALVDRGGCPFVVKVGNAQAAGASGVIVVNNVAGPPIDMGGSDPTITIPAVCVSRADGDTIRAHLGSGVTAALQLDPVFLAGTDDAGQVLVYTPNPLEPGSSVHHWDRSASPDLLLEPSINPGVPHTGDLTVSLAHDIGWFFTDSPIAVEALQANDTGTAIRLSWRLSDDAVRAGVAVFVERAEQEPGPYAALHTTALPAARLMTFEDPEREPQVTRWYRLTLAASNGVRVVSAALPVVASGFAPTSLDMPFMNGGALQIRYRIGGAPTLAQLDVYDVAGHRVTSLERNVHAPGEYLCSWDRTDISGRRVVRGVYFVRLATDAASVARRFVLVR